MPRQPPRKRARAASPAPASSPSSSPPSSPTPAGKKRRTSTDSLSGALSNKENIPPDLPGLSIRRTRARQYDLPSPASIRSISVSDHSNHADPSCEHAALRLTSAQSPETPTSSATPPSTPQSPHTRARTLLRSPSSGAMMGRDSERAGIVTFLERFCEDPACGPLDILSLYISGSPGAGKTALLHEALESVTSRFGTLKTIVINCMGMASLDLHTVKERVLESLEDSPLPPKSLIDTKFTALLSQTDMRCCLVLDEIDALRTNQNIFGSLTQLIQTHRDTLRIIGIANTHTLTSNGLFNPEHTSTIHFTPYPAPSLMSILAARLSPLTSENAAFIPTPTLLLLTRKVANTSGDVRAMVSILSRAIDLSHASKATCVNPSHILEAIKRDKAAQTASSDQLNSVRQLGLHARLVLCVFLLALHRVARGCQLLKDDTNQAASKQTGLSHTSLHSYYCNLLKSSPISPISRNEFVDILSMLEVNGLVLLSLSVPRGREKSQAMVTLASGVRQDEIIRGLFMEQGSKSDEVQEIWDGEMKRISRIGEKSI